MMSKYHIVLVVLIFTIFGCKSSEKASSKTSKDQGAVYKVHERQVHINNGHHEVYPKLIGGKRAVSRNLKYPSVAVKNHIEGTVILNFEVGKKGHAENVKVKRSVGYGCNQAAIRAIKKVRFLPGLKDGKPVRVHYSWPVTFRLK